MNKKIVLLLLAALASGMVACGGSTDSALDGRWVESDVGVTFDKGSFEVSGNRMLRFKGTYDASGGIITITVTHWHGGQMSTLASKWYTKAELKKSGAPDAIVNSIYVKTSGTYSISGNSLTLSVDDGPFEGTVTYTRRAD